MSNVIEIVNNLANREAKRTEADIQAGIRDLLLQASLDLDDEDLDVKLESQLGNRPEVLNDSFIRQKSDTNMVL